MLLAQVLARIVSEGQLTIIDEAGRSHRIKGAKAGPAVTMRVHDWWTGIRLALRPRLALGEAYMDGRLTVEQGNLYDLLDLLGRNIVAVDATPLMRWSYTLQRWLRVLEQYNPIGKAQKNVAHHYDLKRRTLRFLPRSRPAVFLRLLQDRQRAAGDGTGGQEGAHRGQASPQPGQKVLDIGSGWGGMGLYLARAFDVDVTGVTLSREQHGVSSRRAVDEGVCRDKSASSFSTIARSRVATTASCPSACSSMSGPRHYLEYFTKVKELLADDGVMLLHSIGRMEPPGGTNTWLRKYIFPGGYSPRLVGGPGGDREGRTVGDRHRGAAPALRRDAAALARALPGQP